MIDYVWTLRVTSEGPRPVRVFARRHHFDVGAAFSVDDRFPGLTALEYAVGALAAELAAGIRDAAKKKRLEVFRVEASVQATLNDVLAALDVRGATGDAGLQRIAIKLYVDSLEEESVIRSLWDEVLARSPLAVTLGRALNLQITLQVS